MKEREMTAACLRRPAGFELSRVPIPSIQAGEVRLRLAGCGVCASSSPVWEGRPWFSYPCAPGSPGHEGWGHIDAVGAAVTGLKAGAAVAALSFHSFAEYDSAPADRVVILPPELAGRPFPGEALACAVTIYRRARISRRSRVAIVGAGFLGILLIQLAKRAGAYVVALARRPFAREMALACGADMVFPLASTVADTLHSVDGAGAFDRVVECAGMQATLDVASALIAPGGKLVIAGYHQDGNRSIDLCGWNWKGVDIINAHERDLAVCTGALRTAIKYVARGWIDYERLLTHSFTLGRLNDGFALLRSRPSGFIKAFVQLADC